MTTSKPLFLSVIVALAALATPARAELLWVEGEAAERHDTIRHGWYDSVRKGELSGEEWLSHFGQRPAEAAYRIDVETNGPRTLWVRANPIAGARLSWRLDQGPWTAIDFGRARAPLNIAADGKPDMRFVAWIRVGELELKKGARELRFRFDSRNNNHGALDCFVLTTGPFRPRGALKPGAKTGKAEPGAWAFEPEPDAFSDKALWDLSALNEKPAGARGFIKRSRDGEGFVTGDGRPIRFWSINTNVQRSPEPEDLAYHARWLAKRGVNMVRFHAQLYPRSGADLSRADPDTIDQCWRLVAAMKKEGIYVTISPYWGSHAPFKKEWGLAANDSQNLSGLIFWDEKLQAAYRSWLRALYSQKNPYTGVPLARDPAVALIQIQNEDSLLFWTMQATRGAQRRALEGRFAAWLVTTYGGLEKAIAAWGGRATPPNQSDDLAGPRLALYEIWHLTREARGAKARRLADQLRFYSETMRAFNADVARYLREDLGCRQLVNAGNWKTANEVRLLDAERWSYTANDVLAANKYFTAPHQNPSDKGKAGYLISQGDIIGHRSALKNPRALPFHAKQVAGFPFMITESTWVPPNRYQAEGPFLFAAYASLTGVDSLYWFAASEPGWGRPMGKWQLETPTLLGQFPAAAWLFRKGLVRQGAPACLERRALDEVWRREPPIICEDPSFDPNRDATPGARSDLKDGLDPLVFLVGPVKLRYEKGPDEVAPLGRFIDRAKKTVRSNTGELELDYGRGRCTLDAPRAQGACGAIDKVALSVLELDVKNPYAAVLAVSLDDQPLARSRKVLVQIGTIARPYGFRSRPTNRGEQIVSLGSSPWNIEDSALSLSLKNAKLGRATLVDANGLPLRELEVERRGGRLSLTAPRDGLYIVLR